MAIDPSDDQLAYARTRPGVKTAEFRVGDAQKLSFDDDSFDVAIMALVIAFLPDPDKAAAELTRVVQAWRVGRNVHAGYSRRWSDCRPHLHSAGVDGHDDLSASAQSWGFTAPSHGGFVEKRRA
jgi:SAM-dependent methyltransferase